MTSDSSTFRLWLLGLAWTLGPWLSLGLAAVLATLGIRQISRRARSIETRPIQPGLGGFLGVVKDSWIHRVLTWSTLYIVIGCIMLGGLVAAGIQGLVSNGIQESALGTSAGETNVPAAPAQPSSGGALDLILLGGLIMACVTVMVGVVAYRRLRRRAKTEAARLPGRGSSRPLIVRLFHDSKALGITVLVVACWLLWGLLCQAVGLAVYMTPGAGSLQRIPGVETVAIVFLLVLAVAMFGVVFGPFTWLLVRNVKLQVRHLRQNTVARRLFYAEAVILCGLAGSLLNLYLVRVLGRTFWPSVFTR